MKKENIQSRNRKLSAKARKKHSSFASAAAAVDMLKPLEKMYGYGMGMPMTMGPGSMGSITSPYSYMSQQASSMSAVAAAHANSAHAAAAAAQFGTAAAGMHHMAGGFGATSFGGMVSGC